MDLELRLSSLLLDHWLQWDSRGARLATRGCELSRRQTSSSSVWVVCGKEYPKCLASYVIWEVMQDFFFLPTFQFSLFNKGKTCYRTGVLMIGKKISARISVITQASMCSCCSCICNSKRWLLLRKLCVCRVMPSSLHLANSNSAHWMEVQEGVN